MTHRDPEPEVETLSLPQQRYIEVIDDLLRDRTTVRLSDVARELNVRLPSASEAVKRLGRLGFVDRGPHRSIGLTPSGRAVATQLERRQRGLKRFMIDVMGLAPDTAEDVACRLEHCVDRAFAERLANLARFLEDAYPWVLRDIAAQVRPHQSIPPGCAVGGEGI